MKEHRIINRKQLTEVEKAEIKKADPYYRHLQTKVEKEELRMRLLDLSEEQIAERKELMELLAESPTEKNVHNDMRKGSVK